MNQSVSNHRLESGSFSTTVKTEWDPGVIPTKMQMDERIEATTLYRQWPQLVILLKSFRRPVSQLEIAEVGCGTGTASLILSILGSSVTLIDYNKKVLDQAEEIFETYKSKGTFLEANCLQEPESRLRQRFDVVMSGGLAEHFTGEDRLRCFKYHYDLLREGGFACIGVPNRFSPFLQSVIAFRRLTGTFKISVEVPFSYKELKELAQMAGFKKSLVMGTASISRDSIVYLKGFVSALVDLLPKSTAEFLRRWKRSKKLSSQVYSKHYPEDKINDYLFEQFKMVDTDKEYNKVCLTDYLASGLILFAFK